VQADYTTGHGHPRPRFLREHCERVVSADDAC